VLSGVVFYPMFVAVKTSLYDWSLLNPKQPSFIGLENYWKSFRDPIFLYCTQVTIIYTLGCVIPSVLIGLLIAVLLSGRVYGKSLIRALLLVPMIMAPVAVGLIWKVFFWDRDLGLINYFLSFLGIKGVSWLSRGATAKASIIITGIWNWTPFCTLVLEAAISRLPKLVFEAARMDGASRWQIFRHITVPMIKAPLIFVVLFRVTTDFRYFDVIYIITQGGPGIQTRLLSLYVYFIAMRKFQMGYANALGVLMLIMVGALCILIFEIWFGARRARGEALWEK